MTVIACPRCTVERTAHDFIAANGRRCKWCESCRDETAKRQRKASPAQSKPRVEVKERGRCDGCGGVLTRNRTTRLDGRLLCHACWRKEWT